MEQINDWLIDWLIEYILEKKLETQRVILRPDRYCINVLIHSFVHSFVCSFIHSFILSCMPFVNHLLMLAARGVMSVAAADTVEVFVDDRPVHVEPGCTVLQVLSVLSACLRGILSAVKPFFLGSEISTDLCLALHRYFEIFISVIVLQSCISLNCPEILTMCPWVCEIFVTFRVGKKLNAGWHISDHLLRENESRDTIDIVWLWPKLLTRLCTLKLDGLFKPCWCGIPHRNDLTYLLTCHRLPEFFGKCSDLADEIPHVLELFLFAAEICTMER